MSVDPLITPRAAIMTDLAMVARTHGFTVDQIVGRKQTRGLVKARYAAMWLIWWRHSLSVTRVAKIFDVDKTSVFYGIGRHMVRSGFPISALPATSASRILRDRRVKETAT